jgi:hypothetical protein
MALIAADRVKETSTTTGTGTYSLAGAVTGFRTFVAGVGSGNTCYYVATDGTNWEVGLGTVTDASPDTLARTRIIKSSNADAAVNWAAGTRDLFVSPIAARMQDIGAIKGHIYGLTMSNAADTTNDIQVATGEAADESGQIVMVLASAIVKQIDVAWAVGTNAGGMNTGSVANATWYEVHLIYRQDTGVVDVMFTTTANRGTLPTNYTHHRRIGWVRRGTATNLQFVQDGDYFTLVTAINDIAVTKTTTATLATVTVPPNAIGRFRATVDGNTTVNANSAVVLRDPDEDSSAPALATGLGSLGYFDLATCAAAGHFDIRVNGSSQIEHDSEVAQGNLDVSTYGWIDRRRRLADI